MRSITVSLETDPTDRSVFYRATSPDLGAAAESDHVPGLKDRDFHTASALAAQAVSRLGEQLQAGE